MDYPRVFKNLPLLETNRLRLRRLRVTDEADIFAYAHDPEVARYTLWEAHRTPDQSRQFLNMVLEQYLVGEPASWGIVLKVTGRVIGTCGVVRACESDRRIEIGYALGREHWGKGLTTEAMRAVTAFCFEAMGANRVEALCNENNIGSWRVMEKLGMRYEGTLREHKLVRGEAWTCRIYAILKKDVLNQE